MPKSEGDGAVQAWIDLLPDWQTAQARRLDAVVTCEVKNAGLFGRYPKAGLVMLTLSFCR
jgi:hypothetical protein